MKTTHVEVSYQRTFNLEDIGMNKYNSLRLECTTWADLEEGDNAQAAILSLQDLVRSSVRAEFARLPKNEKTS